VIAVFDLDGRHLGHLTGARDVGPGVGRAGDAIGRPVRDQHPAPGELAHRLPLGQPWRQPGHRRHGGMAGGPDRGARPHGMPDEHHRDGTVGGSQGIEFLVEVTHRRGLRAVPAAYPEARPADLDVAPAQRRPDGRGDRDHAQHCGLQRAGGPGASFLASVGHQDHAGDALGRTGSRARVAAERPAARHMLTTVGSGAA
jgi:hypothetical protein